MVTSNETALKQNRNISNLQFKFQSRLFPKQIETNKKMSNEKAGNWKSYWLQTFTSIVSTVFPDSSHTRVSKDLAQNLRTMRGRSESRMRVRDALWRNSTHHLDRSGPVFRPVSSRFAPGEKITSLLWRDLLYGGCPDLTRWKELAETKSKVGRSLGSVFEVRVKCWSDLIWPAWLSKTDQPKMVNWIPLSSLVKNRFFWLTKNG